MIKVESVSKRYSKKSQNALDSVSLEFEKNQITALIGENGAGKTTLLKIIALILKPSLGKVFFDGVEITQENEVQFKEKIGFVSENSAFLNDFTVYELLKSTFEFYKNSQNLNKIIKECSLSDVLSKKIKTLSKGYKQRLSFAIALANNPEVIILDEPISGLDPVQINEVRTLIKKLKTGRTIIFSSHIMQEVDVLCDKIAVIHQGKVLSSGTKSEILEKTNCENLEQAFLFLTNGENKNENFVK